MPVDGSGFVEVVLHVDRHLFAFLEPQDRSRRSAVIADAVLDEVAGIDFYVIDREVVGAGLCPNGRGGNKRGR